MDFITPHRFGVIEEGVYRGSYPTLRNFSFLERLNIKTIVSLIPEPPTKDLQAFCQLLGIRIIHFQINRLTPLNNPSLQKKLVHAINAILAQASPNSDNKANPVKNIYVHCLDGRRVTGLLILLLRRLQNYSPEFSYSEFWRFQLAVNTPYQEELRMNREFDRFVNEINEEFILPSEGLPRFLWDGEPYKVFPTGLKASYSVEKEKKIEKKSHDLPPVPTTTTPPPPGSSTAEQEIAPLLSSLAGMYHQLETGEISVSASVSTSTSASGTSQPLGTEAARISTVGANNTVTEQSSSDSGRVDEATSRHS